MNAKRFPNLFLAGAPKCGSTSMSYYLGQHSSIFAPASKEPFFFASDVRGRAPTDRMSQDYLSLYDEWKTERYALDATTHYFYSRTAPAEIASHIPDARCIIMLRNPIEAVYAYFFEVRYQGVEPITTFEEALSAEERRAKCPDFRRESFSGFLRYRRVYAFAENVNRYQSALGMNNVHVILLDDLESDARSEIAKALEFLSLDASYLDGCDLAIQNASKRAINERLNRFMVSPPEWLEKTAGILIPKEKRIRFRQWIKRANTIPANRPPMKRETRRYLAAEFAPEVEQLALMLDRDLTHWLRTEMGMDD